MAWHSESVSSSLSAAVQQEDSSEAACLYRTNSVGMMGDDAERRHMVCRLDVSGVWLCCRTSAHA